MVVLFTGCGSGYTGELTGVLGRPIWNHIMPFGMVYIPSGQLHVGPSDQDVFQHLWARQKPMSIQGFYMDEMEISNNEYRQFVNHVRDSIAMKLIGGEFLLEEGEPTERIDWDMRRQLDWEDEEYSDILEEMFLTEEERFFGKRPIDPRKLVFIFKTEDLKGAAHNKGEPKSAFIHTHEVPVYPDTLCWIRDFTYSYNEPMTRNYFWHPSFDSYPVVGVTWHQSNAFSEWRSGLYNGYRISRGDVKVDVFRLPYESEWEYAARGGKHNAPYPWGGPYIRNLKGCILANFKPGRGHYMEDGGFYSVRTDAYWPNDFGLYNMAGNVAEWTSTAFYENSYAFVHDLNADIRYDAKEDDPITLKRKVIRGGSWKDIGYYCQSGARAYEYQDTSKSYVGFRNVMTFLGRSIDDAAN